MKKHLLFSTVLTLVASSAFAEETIIATVNGEPIYNKELTRNLTQIPNFDNLALEQQKVIKDKIIQAVTKLEAVVQEAEKLKIQNSTAYKTKLADFEQQLMYSTLLESHLENIITEANLKEYYSKNLKNYNETKAKASHILVPTKAEADEVIQKLSAGAAFSSLAKEFSIGPSSNDGGNLGWFNKEAMVPEFSNAAFALQPGKFTTTPVQTQFGWHVILLEEKVEDTPALFAEVKEDVKEQLMQIEVEKYLESIINKADIVINEE